MNAEIYPDDYEPFKILPTAPYKVVVLVKDRDRSSIVRIETHRAGLEQLKEAVDAALDSLNKTKESTVKS